MERWIASPKNPRYEVRSCDGCWGIWDTKLLTVIDMFRHRDLALIACQAYNDRESHD